MDSRQEIALQFLAMTADSRETADRQQTHYVGLARTYGLSEADIATALRISTTELAQIPVGVSA
jgi:hypothetical protein